LNTKLKSFFKENSIFFIILISVSFLFIFYKIVQFQRFDLREDFTLFENVLWNSCNGRFLIENSYGNSYFSQHFTPIIILLMPIYCFFQSPYTLLVIDGLAISMALIPLYIISKHYTANKFLQFTVLISFIFYDRLFYGLSSNFYMEVFYPLFIFLLIYFMIKEKWLLYWIFFILVITIKEDSNIVLFGIGLYLLLKRNYKIGLISALIPLIVFPVTILYIIPGFPHPYGKHDIAFLERWSNYGNDVKSIILSMFNPIKDFNEIFSREKIKSVIGVLRQFIFIPLLNYKTILLILPYLFFILSSNYGTMYRFEYHYTLILIPILYLAFFENLKWLKTYKFKYTENVISVLLIFTSIYSVNNIYNNIPRDMKKLNFGNKFDNALNMISQIPGDESVSVSKTLISRVPVRLHRTHIPYGLDIANYVIIYKDEKTSSFDEKITPLILDSLRNCTSWKIIKDEGEFVFFRKISP